MNILLFGISNVGKTTIGRIIAHKLGIEFFDIDDEIRKRLKTTLEDFVNSGTLQQRDEIRCDTLKRLIDTDGSKVIAVTPISYHEYFDGLLVRDSVFAVELTDKPENIFDRIVFSDENDRIYKDDEYKYNNMDYYLRDIRKDFEWYHKCNRKVRHSFDLDGRNAEEAASEIIRRYRLK